jgi:DNA-binding CsgD family transcriptional regulator
MEANRPNETNEIKVQSREYELLRILARGCNHTEIAAFLNVSPTNAKKQLRALFLELLVGNDVTMKLRRTIGECGVKLPESMDSSSALEPKLSLYGLPCLRCRVYYAANLNACPICGSSDRVPVDAVPPLATIVPSDAPNSTASSLAASGESEPLRETIEA